MLGTESPRILDVGGGVGEVSSLFVRQGGGATGLVVDPNEKSIEVARSRGLDGFAGTIEEFDTDERFDLVLMLNLIEHVADPVAVMARAAELLNDGGLVWLQTPNFRALDGRLFRHRNWAGYHCPRHWAIFGEAGLRAASLARRPRAGQLQADPGWRLLGTEPARPATRPHDEPRRPSGPAQANAEVGTHAEAARALPPVRSAGGHRRPPSTWGPAGSGRSPRWW